MQRINQQFINRDLSRQRQRLHDLRIIRDLRAIVNHRSADCVEGEISLADVFALRLQNGLDVMEDGGKVDCALEGDGVVPWLQGEVFKGCVADGQVSVFQVHRYRSLGHGLAARRR